MTSPRPVAVLLSGLCLQAVVWSADPPPQFTPEGVVRGPGAARRLVPGTNVSIYGSYLGSRSSGCAATPGGLYAGNPCDTQVLIGDKAAILLFVSPKQINFKVPLDVPPSDAVDLRVVYRGQVSIPLKMQVGPERVTISVNQPAYAGMPVWLKVELPFEYGAIHYPYILGLAGFGCNEVEVRKDGDSLPLKPGSEQMPSSVAFVGNICGSSGIASRPDIVGRLPLHVLYDFGTPGQYEIRYTLRSEPFGALQPTGFKTRSEWTPFEILP